VNFGLIVLRFLKRKRLPINFEYACVSFRFEPESNGINPFTFCPKNVKGFLDVLCTIKHIDFTMDIVGDGEEFYKIQNLIKSNKLENKIVLHGKKSHNQALDILRVIGNNAVHPGQIDVDDNKDVALKLFKILNMIADDMITKPKEMENLYNDIIPDEIKNHINDRDGN
jgi:hypothetical protein